MEITPATVISRMTSGKHSRRDQKFRVDRWKQHQNQLQEELGKNYVDMKGSLKWLTNGAHGFHGERIIIGVQDQDLLTNRFKKMAGISQNDNSNVNSAT